MYSMTGYGRGECEREGVKVCVEIKTVNNRYLDISMKCPRIFISCDDAFRKAIGEKITRGHIDVYVSYSDKRANRGGYALDEGLVAALVDGAKRIHKAHPEVAEDLSASQILRYPDILISEEAAADDVLAACSLEALDEALESLTEMRKKEGEKLAADVTARMDNIEKLLKGLVARAPLVVGECRERLEKSLSDALAGWESEPRLLTEVALFADKCNIDEELTRIGSHIEQFRAIVKEATPGKKMDFLIQEFNRECNTICSKANDLEITNLALEMKNEIEKVREQVQNIE